MYETLITHYNCPVYFSQEMAEDAGVAVEKFMPAWKETEEDRWVGKYTFEETVADIMKDAGCYSEEKLNLIFEKRMATKRECFRHLHEGVIPMLEELKRREIKIGLISNCFSEEVTAIRESVLFPYFDKACLSYEEQLQKPDPEIFHRCMDGLGVKPEECLYIGDGGCQELETAKKVGMHPLQACWYFQEWIRHQTRRNPEFEQLDAPMDVMKFL